MGTNMNFMSFGNDPPSEGNGYGRNFSVVRQPSVYSLTFDEFQNSIGKEFGSMNMDELLKNIWSAEETQSVGSAAAPSGGNQVGHLQKQGSLTLSRTLSQKTVDEVWRGLTKEFGAGNDSRTGASMPQETQRQPTLGEITLEEFLVRAGVVREDAQTVEPNPGGFLGDLTRDNNNYNTSLKIDFQQPSCGLGLMGNYLANNGAQISLESPNLPINVNGERSSHQQPITAQMPQQQLQQRQQQQLHQQPIFPNQFAAAYAPSLAMPGTTQLGSPGFKGGMVGLISPTINGTLDQVSPMQGGGLRGRKGNGVEKVIERRQKRMIKNRESAARSRSRKQVYTMELEQEIQKLKDENENLRLKQAQIIEMQKNEASETLSAQNGSKKSCLRRTQTAPW